MDPEAIRRMEAGWRIAEQRVREERRTAGADPSRAVEAALALMDLYGELHDWPPAENSARRRNDRLARERWERVRLFYRTHGKAAKPEAP